MHAALTSYKSLSALADEYDLILCDVWGVVHDGVAIYAAAADALRRFRKGGGSVILVSNASRLGATIMSELERMGLPRTAFDAVITSGDVTRDFIATRPGCTLFDLGPGDARPICSGLATSFTSICDADFAISSGAFENLARAPEDLKPLFTDMLVKSMLLLCANPDVATELGGRRVQCSGAVAELYSHLGGAVHYGGKPDSQIYEKALAVAAELRGGEPRRERVLAIGDSLRTDIAGAAANGFASLFVLGGIHSKELGIQPSFAAIEQLCTDMGSGPTAVTDRLTW
jgi:HAD superfamily hydrolase (TIGR01459 family)